MEIIAEIIRNFFYQIVFSVGVIAVFGLLIALCRKAFCYIVGDGGAKILFATGIVGTPVHELSHALMCLIFGHRINEIKLYDPDSSDGTLGYVNHSYNPKNIYHQIGNFFIGVAPIIGGSGLLLLLMRLMVADVYVEVTDELNFIGVLSTDFFDGSTYLGFLDLFWSIIKTIFDFTNTANVWWWIFIILSLMISSHMELSVADIKGGFRGFLYIAALILGIDIILAIISGSLLESFTELITMFSAYIASFLGISGIFSGVLILIALAINGVKKALKK